METESKRIPKNDERDVHMRKTTFAKIAAVCGAAMLGMTGLTAFAQTNANIEDRSDIVEGKTNIAAGIVRADPGEVVKFPIYVVNNTPSGFTSLQISVTYDQRLVPCLKADGGAVTKKGDACNELVTAFSHDAEKHTIKLKSEGSEPEMDSGILFEFELIMPADYGGKFPVTVTIDQFLDAENQPVASAAVNGYIYAEGEPLRGDVNLDGEVAIEDAQMVWDYICEHLADPCSAESPALFYAGDVDEDGVLSMKDVESIHIYYNITINAAKPVEWSKVISREVEGISEGYEKTTGDLNYDQKVDVKDAQAALAYYVKKLADSEFDDHVDRSAGDVDQNGKNSVEDAQYILEYYTQNTIAMKATDWAEIISKKS